MKINIIKLDDSTLSSRKRTKGHWHRAGKKSDPAQYGHRAEAAALKLGENAGWGGKSHPPSHAANLPLLLAQVNNKANNLLPQRKCNIGEPFKCILFRQASLSLASPPVVLLPLSSTCTSRCLGVAQDTWPCFRQEVVSLASLTPSPWDTLLFLAGFATTLLVWALATAPISAFFSS